MNRIEVLDTGELFLGLEGEGHAWYQYVYREAAGVYWDPTLKGFRSTELKEWSPSEWFDHMVAVVRVALGVELLLSKEIRWIGISEKDKEEISFAGDSRQADC